MIALSQAVDDVTITSEVVAIIISYNPDIERLQQNINAVAGHCES